MARPKKTPPTTTKPPELKNHWPATATVHAVTGEVQSVRRRSADSENGMIRLTNGDADMASLQAGNQRYRRTT